MRSYEFLVLWVVDEKYICSKISNFVDRNVLRIDEMAEEKRANRKYWHRFVVGATH